MKTDEEIKLLLDKVENLVKRVAALKNPPDNLKMENFGYRSLLLERDMFQWLLGDDGIDLDAYYNDLNISLINLEKKQDDI